MNLSPLLSSIEARVKAILATCEYTNGVVCRCNPDLTRLIAICRAQEKVIEAMNDRSHRAILEKQADVDKAESTLATLLKEPHD